VRHFIYTSAADPDSDWVYGGPIREEEALPFVWPGCMIAAFKDEGPDKPAWKQAFFERDRRNMARRALREKRK
jgi:hypothetical protein